VINLVSTRRERQYRRQDAARVLGASLRLSAAELEDLTKRDSVDPQELRSIIERLRDDAQLIELAGGAA
jgi:hypothetical protein